MKTSEKRLTQRFYVAMKKNTMKLSQLSIFGEYAKKKSS